MKLSDTTIELLKNFCTINQGIVVKGGNILSTCSPAKNILAEAKVTEVFPVTFGIYDLRRLLQVLSLYSDGAEIDFQDRQLVVSDSAGKRKTTYRYTEPSLIVSPPDKKLTLPSDDIQFELTSEELDWVRNAAAVLGSPQVAIQSDGKTVGITAYDTANDAADTNTLSHHDGNGDIYNMIFKTENLKMIPDAYEVTVTEKNIARFVNKNRNLTYWVSTEVGSVFKSHFRKTGS